jgi:CRP-like cAMP-binding protein
VRQFTTNPPPEDELRRLTLPFGQPRLVGRHEVLARRGEVPETMWLVQHGWALARGLRQTARAPILRVYLPGDMIGLTELALGQLPHDLVTLTDGLLHAVPRQAITTVARQNPRIWPLVLSQTAVELARAEVRATLFDRAVAEDRLIHFLMDLRGRLAVEGIGDGNRFPLPMNQQEIGEATGMTGIYVNRLMGKLVREGRIEVQRPYVRLLDRAYLERRMDFLDSAPRTEIGWAARG